MCGAILGRRKYYYCCDKICEQTAVSSFFERRKVELRFPRQDVSPRK